VTPGADGFHEALARAASLMDESREFLKAGFAFEDFAEGAAGIILDDAYGRLLAATAVLRTAITAAADLRREAERTRNALARQRIAAKRAIGPTIAVRDRNTGRFAGRVPVDLVVIEEREP
jgi:hypothetical protein